MAIEIPTAEQLLEEDGFDVISQDSIDRWRHGTLERSIYKRESDGTYWRATYRVSTDGETNELREGLAKIVQVEPQEVTVIEYRPVAA